jgi:hypothetical protein
MKIDIYNHVMPMAYLEKMKVRIPAKLNTQIGPS